MNNSEHQLLQIIPDIGELLQKPVITRLKHIRLSNPPIYSCYEHAINACRMCVFAMKILKYRHISLNITDAEIHIAALSCLFYFTGTPPYGPFSMCCSTDTMLEKSAKNVVMLLTDTEFMDYIPWIQYIIYPPGYKCPDKDRAFLVNIVSGMDDLLGIVPLDYTWRRGSLLQNGIFSGFCPVNLLCHCVLNNEGLSVLDGVKEQLHALNVLKRYLETCPTELPISISKYNKMLFVDILVDSDIKHMSEFIH